MGSRRLQKNNRLNHHTLIRLIKHHVHLGTIILSDTLTDGYTHLVRHGFTHLNDNHRRGLIDLLTGIHTNTCGGMRLHATRHVRGGHGRTRTDPTALEIALGEFMWQKKFNLTRSDISIRFNREIPQLINIVVIALYLFGNIFSI